MKTGQFVLLVKVEVLTGTTNTYGQHTPHNKAVFIFAVKKFHFLH